MPRQHASVLRSSVRPPQPALPLRRIAGALLLALVALAGCNQTAVPPYTGILAGVYDLALVGDLLFITSSDHNELRVFDTSLSPRDFVRAPNPLEPLSIPVVSRPVGVVRDVHYDSTGAEVGGPYVYAYGTAEPFISVVGADRSLLREMLPAGTPDAPGRLRADGPVSAIAAHGPTQATDFPGGRTLAASRLFYATAVGNEGHLYRVDLLGSDAINGSNPQSQLLQRLTGEFVIALAAMPDPDRVVVATRSQSGQTGRAYILNIADGSMVPLHFPYPVRRLVVTPGFRDPNDPTNGAFVVEPGANVFGVFDEESCGASTDCNGLLAVQTATGQVANDVTGYPMFPIRFGQALPIGLHIAQNAYVVSNASTNTATPFSLLGMGTASDGRIFFFDAYKLRQIDVDPGAPTSGVTLQSPDTTTQTFDATKYGVLVTNAAEGAALNQTIYVVREGVFPGMLNVPTSDADGLRFPVSALALADVVPGDTIVISTAASADCGEVPVSSTDAGAVYAASIPAGCTGRTAFSVRAGPNSALPYVVVGTASGYMGRTQAGQTFTYQGTYFYHPDNFSPGNRMIEFTLAGPDDPRVVRDWQWVIATTSGFQSLSFSIDTTYPTLTQYVLPGAIVDVPGKTIAFVAYPSASGLIEFNPPLIAPNQANNQNIVPYP